MEAKLNEKAQRRSVALQETSSIPAACDQTEQMLVETRNALELMRATLDSTTDGILVKDESGKISGFNKKFAELWDIPQEIAQATGLDQLQNFISKKVPKGRVSLINKDFEGLSAEESHDILELKDGRVFEQFSKLQRINNRIVGRVWSFRDITDRKKAEEGRAYLAAVVDSSDDAIISKTLDGIIRTWNRGAERIFGYTPDEAIGRHISILIPPSLQEEEPQIIERLKKGERIDHYETIRVRKDGTLLNISLTVSPIRDTSGTIVGASKIARDITERKETDQKLFEANRRLAERRQELERLVNERTQSLQEAVEQMEEFSYSVSHDLRAPLRAMQGYASALLEDYGNKIDPEGHEYLKRIVSAGARMDRLTRDVLTYSKIPRTKLHLDRISLDKIVTDVIQQYVQDEARRSEIKVNRPLHEVKAHEALLVQAVSNLIDNAVKFSAPERDSYIHIWSEIHDNQVRLWVEDNGIGIKPEYQERVWGMFERIHPRGQYEGTGIGLAIVRKAIERMDGTVGFNSDGMTGSKFWIQLPRPSS